MADSTDIPKGGFLRKVVRFALNPTTEWSDLNRPSQLPDENDQAKQELKAMIERKRRNDFVRKREFEMLRKIRREGVTGEGLAGLDGLSNLDDSEMRLSEDFGLRSDTDVKDKIDAIERMMVGDLPETAPRRGQAVMTPVGSSVTAGLSTLPPNDAAQTALLNAFKPTTPLMRDDDEGAFALKPLPREVELAGRSPSPSPAQVGWNEPMPAGMAESAHDPDLDEAVMAFANGDDAHCENLLQSLLQPGGTRSGHAETWLVLFDLYRATGQQARFDALAMDYTQRFGWSPPQWWSLPQLVADAATSGDVGATRAAQFDAGIGWNAPEVLDADGIARLRTRLLNLPQPWVMDWSALLAIDVQAAAEGVRLMHDWGDQALDIRWIGGSRLLQVLADVAPTGARDVDPAFWMLRLEALRLANRPNEFDQTALDYCMTFEVSPPSWTPAQCVVKLVDPLGATEAGDLPPPEHSQDRFVESLPYLEADANQADIELNGQLVGDIDGLLKRLTAQTADAERIHVSCARLVRMDFLAAGDVLNWVIARRQEGRSVTFTETHRLVALFCGAMGISEHARVATRRH